ncbi:MAG TPA: prepilin-type N-terminal cleavage/methylation domain-containing protein [Bacilli bacterium]|nr:prepilin-type N-terminal cleavage/methylation domain-containing protein [Bacilli bacterium]
MKNKGFTLIEMLAVVIILAVLVLIATPAVISISARVRTNMYCTKIEMLEKAGEMYAQENTLDEICTINSVSYSCKNITVHTLISLNYVDADKNDTILTDPRDDSSMNDTEIIVYQKGTRYYTIIEAAASVCN